MWSPERGQSTLLGKLIIGLAIGMVVLLAIVLLNARL